MEECLYLFAEEDKRVDEGGEGEGRGNARTLATLHLAWLATVPVGTIRLDWALVSDPGFSDFQMSRCSISGKLF